MKPSLTRLIVATTVAIAHYPLLAHGDVEHGTDALEQTDPASEMAMLQAYFTAWNQGDYLGALTVFERAGVNAFSPQLRSSYSQFRPSLDGFVVEDKQPIILDAEGDEIAFEAPPVREDYLQRLAATERRDAITTITELAGNTRIVIVNETHDNPRDRAFVMDVAEALRPLGYTHYAAETFANHGTAEQVGARMDALYARGYPLLDDGYYSKGPAFGYALRRVLAAGYRPVSYEWVPRLEDRPSDPKDSIALREAAQAQNLAQALAAAGPDAKFLIHVGYSHAAEDPFPNGQKWMAAQLRELTGIDPLTVNQTDLSQYARPAEHAAIASHMAGAPVVLFENGAAAKFGINAELMDLQVVHPPITALDGRPDWLARTGRTARRVPAELMPQSRRRLVQVFLTSDSTDAVPIDQVLIEAGAPAPVVYVPQDARIRWATQDGPTP